MPSDIDFSSPQIFDYFGSTTLGLNNLKPVVEPALVKEVMGDILGPDEFDGTNLRKVSLDSTASGKMLRSVFNYLQDYLGDAYANPHSENYTDSQVSTELIEETRSDVLRFVGANSDTHMAIFVGHGATGALNLAAMTLFADRYHGQISNFSINSSLYSLSGNNRRKVFYTEAEHHANMLPWRYYAGQENTDAIPVNPNTGLPNLDKLEEMLKENAGKVRLVAMTAASNVIGVMPDLKRAAQLAHQYGAEILIDCAQRLAHAPINMQELGVDYLVFSGHKVYAPGSPGVLVMPKSAARDIPVFQGGGIVKAVTLDSVHYIEEGPTKEEAGTPNAVGIVMLKAALETLSGVGMSEVFEHEQALLNPLIQGLSAISGVKVFGDTDITRTPRVGVSSLNMEGLHYSILARSLNDYWHISVRDGCFCAHPLVNALYQLSPEDVRKTEIEVSQGNHANKPGMVRPSLGIYNSKRDISRLHRAMDWSRENRKLLNKVYAVDHHGNVHSADGWVRPTKASKPRLRF